MANLVSSPRKFKNKVLLLKLETAYGVDATPTGAANWIEARDLTFTPMEVDKVERNIVMPYMGNAGSILTGFWAKLSFSVAMVGSGVAGTAPKWAPALLAAGFAETVVATTSAAYNLVSTGHLSMVGYINIDGVLHKMLGMRGNAKGSMAQKGIPTISFDFDALYVTPVNGAPPAVTRTGWAIEDGVNSVNTAAAKVNGIDLAWSAFEWDVGYQVSRVDLPGPQKEIELSDRKPTASLTVVAPDLAVFNPFAMAESNATYPLIINHGTVTGKKVRIDLQAKVLDVSYEEIEGMVGYKLSLEPTPVIGNDEIALTCL